VQCVTSKMAQNRLELRLEQSVLGGACADDVVQVSARVALAWCGERAVRGVRAQNAAAL
jgi:hypothetical protein